VCWKRDLKAFGDKAVSMPRPQLSAFFRLLQQHHSKVATPNCSVALTYMIHVTGLQVSHLSGN
jgi:hypothetical protein